MFKNYFFLLRSVNYLDKILSGARIIDIYSQEKNKLFLHLPSDENPYRHLIISTNPHSPYLLIKNNHHKAKKNVVDFFSDYLPSKLIDIKIATNDRLINFTFDSLNLYFSISGNKTNVYLVADSNIEGFKKIKESFFEKINSKIFKNDIELTFIDNNNKNYNEINVLKKDYPMISGEIKKEIIFRNSSDPSKSIFEIFKQICIEILRNKIKVGFSDEEQKFVFIPESFTSTSLNENFKLFSIYNDALQFYLSAFYSQEKNRDVKKELEKYFDKELAALANKLNKLHSRVESGSNEQKYYDQANLLLTNIYKMKKGMSEIIITNNDIDTILKLDPKLSPNENIKKYFEKAKGEKLNYNKSVELFNFTKHKYDSLNNDYKIFRDSKNLDELETLHNKLIVKKEKLIKMDSGLKFKYWHYLIDDKYHVYIGRDSKSNDYLSLKFAKQNDYWFHARGLPGSHVVLRVDNVKEGVPKDIIKKAASLAGYHSKAKTAGSSPISYTFAKFVHKKKGMEPGKVLLQKEQTLLVKPEIPKNCVLVDE
jgi:predicted ribosome quality control (RQC) complex YloA/Tae2 family protein